MIRMYTKAALIAVVAGGLNLAVVAPSQAYTGHPAEGRRCSFTSVTDPTIENGGVQTGQINGGPLVATAPGATISMRCTIQVGAENSTHAGTDSCAVQSPPSLQVTAIPPTTCSYDSPEGQPVYMCTEITVNGVTYYWDALPAPGSWSTSSSADCDEAISQEIFPGPFEPALLLLDEVICPVLGLLAPSFGPFLIDPSGDMWYDENGDGVRDPEEFFWDCPPYVGG